MAPHTCPMAVLIPTSWPRDSSPNVCCEYAELGRDPDPVADAVAEGEGVEHPARMQEQQPRYRERHAEQGHSQRPAPADGVGDQARDQTAGNGEAAHEAHGRAAAASDTPASMAEV